MLDCSAKRLGATGLVTGGGDSVNTAFRGRRGAAMPWAMDIRGVRRIAEAGA